MSEESAVFAPFDEDVIYRVDPFEGDFGEPDDKTLSSYVVTARTAHACGICVGLIPKLSRYWSLVKILGGSLMCYRFCALCCAAMAKSREDAGKEWEARTIIGNQRRKC